MQARKAYSADDIKINEQFIDMHLEIRGGRLGLDFAKFDVTSCATSELMQVRALLGALCAAWHGGCIGLWSCSSPPMQRACCRGAVLLA